MAPANNKADQNKPAVDEPSTPKTVKAAKAPAQPKAKISAATAGKQRIADRRPAKAGPTVTVTQINSGAGRLKDQRQTLTGLGLGKLRRTRVLEDTPAVRGMIKRVKHLVRVEDAQ